MLRASVTLASIVYPLHQVTLRREAYLATLDMQIAGDHAIAAGAACVLSVTGTPAISGTVTASTHGPRTTSVAVDLAVAAGSGQYTPARLQFLSTGLVRADVDFSVLPGDTYEGRAIAAVTSTMGAASPWFTEVRF